MNHNANFTLQGGYVKSSKANQHADKSILALEGRLNQLLLEQEMISFSEGDNLTELKVAVFLQHWVYVLAT